MSTPKRHGGGFIPAVKASLSFTRRSTVDQSSSGQDRYSRPQSESTPVSNLPSSHNSNTTKRHGGGFVPSTTNTRVSSLGATTQQQPQINAPASVETAAVSSPQTNSSSVKHGGGYVPKSLLQENGARAPAASTSSHVPAQMEGDISQTAVNNGHTSNGEAGALAGGVERPDRRRHGGGSKETITLHPVNVQPCL
ncbi:predicted protein [Aspergillus nidulans FGSC A4]|uniref:Uncharacterized protein n=1 Tax=Emericella nidulans (strain FGSC A4 / ATCC 38163 / CBS 112.46 / NRRL 194 / M139) TaxID=227321 RepID=Q5B237_EMENI|nr:hypothetical protein [Aspergillus nidulans FGSC A4]EAA62553.1 predicted protein [Aspergillus nidulans FGSC A4]CBF81982.1 TPA: conserved hypothetical protein [Aspergillus nidulans FGSC A4]|eukprot:XP_662997.1 predicted protein [Aspergillus nidulans FGSC A4]